MDYHQPACGSPVRRLCRPHSHLTVVDHRHDPERAQDPPDAVQRLSRRVERRRRRRAGSCAGARARRERRRRGRAGGRGWPARSRGAPGPAPRPSPPRGCASGSRRPCGRPRSVARGSAWLPLQGGLAPCLQAPGRRSLPALLAAPAPSLTRVRHRFAPCRCSFLCSAPRAPPATAAFAPRAATGRGIRTGSAGPRSGPAPREAARRAALGVGAGSASVARPRSQASAAQPRESAVLSPRVAPAPASIRRTARPSGRRATITAASTARGSVAIGIRPLSTAIAIIRNLLAANSDKGMSPARWSAR